MIRSLATMASKIFDRLDTVWEGPASRRAAGSLLVLSFVGSLVLIECNRQGWLPAGLSSRLPTNHFYGVKLAFTLLLVYEVITLVFCLVGSVANSVGKQFEILSLILVRKSSTDCRISGNRSAGSRSPSQLEAIAAEVQANPVLHLDALRIVSGGLAA